MACCAHPEEAYKDGTIVVDMDALSLLLPVGHQRASTAVPHREVRGAAGSGEPVEVTSHAAIDARARRE
jgi:hypothetical protein